MSELPFTKTQLELMDHVFGCASLGKKLGLSKEQKQQCARIALVFEALVSQQRIKDAPKEPIVKKPETKKAKGKGASFINTTTTTTRPKEKSASVRGGKTTGGISTTRKPPHTQQAKRRKSK